MLTQHVQCKGHCLHVSQATPFEQLALADLFPLPISMKKTGATENPKDYVHSLALRTHPM